MAIGPFKPSDGILITKVANGGFVVESRDADHRLVPATIGAYTTADDLLRDLAAALCETRAA